MQVFIKIACLSPLLIVLVQPSLAQQMPGHDLSIILSKGVTIHRIENPSLLPATFSQIKDDRLIVPVPAGKLLLRFEDRRLGRGKEERQLVLTEDGVWGYMRVEAKLFEAEPRLREIYDSKDTEHVILRNDYFLTLAALPSPIKFGRGEIYAVSADSGQSEDNTLEVVLSEDKRQDILRQNPGFAAENIPRKAALPHEVLQTIDIAQALPDSVYFGKERAKSYTNYARIFESWRKAIPETRLSSFKPCDQSSEQSTSNSEQSGFKIEGDVGGEASFWTWFKAKAGISGELARQSEKTVKEISKTSGETELLIKAWSIKRGAENSVLFLIRNKNCKENTAWYAAQSDDIGRRDIKIDELDITSDTKKDYNHMTGILTVRCYTDYVRAVPELSKALDLSEQDVSFLLSRVGRLPDWQVFFSCK